MEKRVADQKQATQQNQEQNQQEENADIGNLLNNLLNEGQEEQQEKQSNEQTTSEENQQEQQTEEQGQTEEQSQEEEQGQTEEQEEQQTVEGNVLEVALDPDTPRNITASKTAKHVKVMKISFTAGSEDVTLNSVVVKLNGLMKRTDVDKVYLVNSDDVVVTTDKKIKSDYTAELTFKTDDVVKANEVKSYYLVVDFKADASRYGYFTVESVDASVEVKGDFPLESAMVNLVDYTSDTIDFKVLWTSSDTIYVGDTNVEVYKFQLEENWTDDKDSVFKSITIKSSGDDVEGRLDNFKLIVGWKNIAKKVIIDGDEVTLVVDDYVLKDGETKTFYVYADVVGGEDDDKVQFYIDWDPGTRYDVDSNGTGTYDLSQKIVVVSDNAAVPVYEGKGEKSNNTYGKTLIFKEGDMLITKASESPTSSYIPNDEDNITVLVVNFNATAALDVDSFKISVQSSTGLYKILDEMKLYLDDKLVDSVTIDSNYNGTSEDVIFDYDGEISKGVHKFVIKVDTEKDAPEWSWINNVTFSGGSFIDAEYVATNNDVKASDLKGSASSSKFTIKKPKIESISRNDGYNNPDTVVKGVNDFMVLRFTVQANNVRDLKINGFTLSGVKGDWAATPVAKVRVNGQIIDSESFNDGVANFNGLDITVPKGSTTDIDILVDLTTSYSKNNLKVKVKDFDVEDSKGNSVDTSWVNVESVLFNVKAGATVYVARDNNTPDEAIIPANTDVKYEVAKFKFKAVDDDAEIQELTLVNVTKNFNYKYATWGTYTGVYGNAGADQVVQKVFLYDENGNELANTSLTNSGVAYFALSNPITLPRDQEVVITVKIQPSAINDTGIDNKYVRFAILSGNVNGTTKRTKIVSKSNGVEVAPTINDIAVADAQFIRATVITLSDIQQNDITLDGGVETLYGFKVAVDEAGAAKIKEFRFDLTVTDSKSNNGTTWLTLDSFEFWADNTNLVNTNDAEITIASTGCANATGGNFTSTSIVSTTAGDHYYCVRVVFTGSYLHGYEIGHNSAETFLLKAKVSNLSDNDSVSTRLNEIWTGAEIMTGYSNLESRHVSIIWSDEAADEVLTGTANWFDDDNVEKLPLNSWTLTK